MKKIFKFSLLALFIGFTSCEDATDIIQDSELGEEVAYRTLGDLQTGLNGVYAAYTPDSGSNGTGDAILFNDLFTDNMKRGIASTGQGNEVYGFFMQPGSQFPGTLWSNRYAVINFSNRLLRAYDRIVPGLEEDADIETAERIKAQALTLRALCHFDLLQYFTEDYQNTTSLAVPILDIVPQTNQVFPRNTAGEVFDFIIGDLEQASTLIGDFGDVDANVEHPFYVSQDVINAIRARVALYQGDYTLAGNLASALLADHAIITNPTDYFNMFISDEPKSEQIFTLARLQGDNGVVALYYANQATIDGSPFFEMSNGLLNTFSNDDVRRQVLLETSSNYVGLDSPDNVLLIGKYRGSAADQTVNHIKLIRSSEMLFILAETQARAGSLTEAANSIASLRGARTGTTPALTYATTGEALTDILLERRKELAFEGHRYLDLKRLGVELGIGINRNPTDCGSFFASCGLPSTDYRFTLPIPRVEIRANPTIEQNTGY
ncbi:MAG: hypothetical protein BM557_04705 [Flavobacterium sp. MedPE-SWcel]|uniref:RagB/SusD family nutrient uptake outer membrane protein n=1 Tax=uncultured Flavobacterium sp. TaxID=165435 RepID=UPI000915CE25|nr:RagB/SusD family nutrient uptake outer membrane protein [uncultured Flavobacterium sp.]OIQ21060.1 MAG: hypothetical protein BM557_04705 [Flavobacterium sp. MedPE-SWcel]